MSHLRYSNYLGIAILLFAASGCGESDLMGAASSGGNETLVIQQAVEDTEDEESLQLFSTDFLSGQGGLDLSLKASSSISGLTHREGGSQPHHWYREITDRDHEFDIHIQDGLASVQVTTRLEGILHLNVDEDDLFGEKAFELIGKRFATFLKVPHHPRDQHLPLHQHGHWKLVEISPIEVSLADSENQTVQIEGITTVVDNQVRWEVSDPSTLFSIPSGLPIFSPGEEVVITARITNIGDGDAERPTFVYLHHDRHREAMFDDGETGGDEVAGDGIFTKTKTIGPRLGFHHAAIDALDAEVFEDETTDNYNGEIWGMPYLVTRSYTGTMHHVDVEGGCWKFVTDDGESFEPHGGSDELYEDGQRVTLQGFPREHRDTICQVGPVLRIVSGQVESSS